MLFNFFSSPKVPIHILMEQAEILKKCTSEFQHAIDHFLKQDINPFYHHTQEVTQLQDQSSLIKDGIGFSTDDRKKTPKIPKIKYEFFHYLKEQDDVMDSLKLTLYILSYRSEQGLDFPLKAELFSLIESVMGCVRELYVMMSDASSYFDAHSEVEVLRKTIVQHIQNLHEKEHAADLLEHEIKQKAFHLGCEAGLVFYLLWLAEVIGSIADHAENVGDMMELIIAN
ncbi:MAG: DUF47 family protein [Desulfobacterales bacterium]|nr:DUF47 family protein [Desulfobacterales bacterium]